MIRKNPIVMIATICVGALAASVASRFEDSQPSNGQARLAQLVVTDAQQSSAEPRRLPKLEPSEIYPLVPADRETHPGQPTRNQATIRLVQAIESAPAEFEDDGFLEIQAPANRKPPATLRIARASLNAAVMLQATPTITILDRQSKNPLQRTIGIDIPNADDGDVTVTVTNPTAGDPLPQPFPLTPNGTQYTAVVPLKTGDNTIIVAWNESNALKSSTPLSVTVLDATMQLFAQGDETAAGPVINARQFDKGLFTAKFTGDNLGNIAVGDQLNIVATAVESEIVSTISTVATSASSNSDWENVDLRQIENAGKQRLDAYWWPKDPTKIINITNNVEVDIDTRSPVLDNVNLTGSPETGMTLVLTFAEGDLNSSTVDANNLAIKDMSESPPTDLSPPGDVVYNLGSKTVHIFVSRLKVGTYKLQVNTGLEDLAGNAAKLQESLFSPEPSPEQGPRIEFPPYLPALKDPSARRPNPGDRVETRVARLFYFRDAQRVAQLINRMTKSYNRAAVTQAQRRAEAARVKANTLTDERRAKERAAVEAAVETRRYERNLQQAYQEIQRLNQLQNTAQRQTTSTGQLLGGTTTDGTLTAATIESVQLKSGRIVNIRVLPAAGDLARGTIVNGSLGEGLITSGSETTSGTATPITDERITAGTQISSGEITFSLPADATDLQPIDAIRITTPVKITGAALTIPDASGNRTVTSAVIEDGALSNGQIYEIKPMAGMLAAGTVINGEVERGLVTDGDFSGQVTAANLDGVTQSGTIQILSGDVQMGVITSGEVDGEIQFNLPQVDNLDPIDASSTLVVNKISGAKIDNGAGMELKRVTNATFAATPPSTQDVGKAIEQQRNQIGTLENNLRTARSNEVKKNEAWKEAEAAEDRAVEDQFLADVAAAHEDPDTYAPATKNSVDPVAQVSISVIGEGLIHLRGPIHGINEIRKMINQIDSPVGQVKVGIHTIQINGEKGDRMERVAGRIEGHLDLGRTLTNYSLRLLRRAVQVEAAQVAQMSEGGHYQVDRDRRYLYNFFGRDFIDELYEMDSEFLRSQNKLLSLHSMDTISLNRALFIMALAKNDVRERILHRFLQLVQTDLPQAEWDFRRSSELHPHKTRRHLPFSDKTRKEEHTLNRVYRNAHQRYHFRNLRSFFEMESSSGVCLTEGHVIGGDGASTMMPDTMNSMQRTFLRLAQIFKSQMIAEEEVKQRIIERAIIEDKREESFAQEQQELRILRQAALDAKLQSQQGLVQSQRNVVKAVTAMETAFFQAQGVIESAKSQISQLTKELEQLVGSDRDKEDYPARMDHLKTDYSVLRQIVRTPGSEDSRAQEESVKDALSRTPSYASVQAAYSRTIRFADLLIEDWENLYRLFQAFADAAQRRPMEWGTVVKSFHAYSQALETLVPETQTELRAASKAAWTSASELHRQNLEVQLANDEVASTRAPLDHKKLLDFLIDEREEKQIELLEGTRAYIAAVDQYLKRLSTALEDDFKVQFYDPAFVQIRSAAREYDVQLGQVERTTILMNNRAIAIVKPTATMEFDLPKRDIVIVEALKGAKALAQDYGALLNDPTFLAAYQMMGGGKQANKVVNPLPTLDSQTNQQGLGLSTGEQRQPGSSLQSLVPDPAVYKFETGTGFEIRPVIQPDGDSIVYDFHYMYTTNIREPVRADEKHLGRIKRHFIDTQVQTSSFELREVSRYLVALKASRTSRGVPLFEDIPGLGMLFRPAPSDESSLQQNIILAKSTVYPTLFDLMGLRWARHVVDLDHVGLRNSEHIVRGRNTSIEDFVFDKASDDVDKFLDIPRAYPQHYRPDLYHRQREPSPYHPNGFIYEPQDQQDGSKPVPGGEEDPTGGSFRQPDLRPPELQSEPPYDDRFRRPYQYEQMDTLEDVGVPLGTKLQPNRASTVTRASYELPVDHAFNRRPTRQTPPMPSDRPR